MGTKGEGKKISIVSRVISESEKRIPSKFKRQSHLLAQQAP